MPYKDLRDFLERLESEGQLLRVKKEVLLEPDIGAAAYAAGEISNGPAIFFEKIKGYDQKISLRFTEHFLKLQPVTFRILGVAEADRPSFRPVDNLRWSKEPNAFVR